MRELETGEVQMETRDGYYNQPTVHGSGVEGRVVFVSEDDLWEVPLQGGRARRLTSGKGASSHPAFSPDGTKLAFTGTEEGATEVFVMDSRGGPLRQLTYNGTSSAVVGWTPDGEYVVFRSNYREPFSRVMYLYKVPLEGGAVERIPLGQARSIDWQSDGPGRVLGRHTEDIARWKRYRGGTAGTIWLDVEGQGDWRELMPAETSGLVCPMWIDGRIYFISDFEGWGNIYSCRPDGSDLDRHTHHEDFYARYARTDGESIVYQCGGDLWRLDPAENDSEPIDVDYGSPRTQLNRRFVDAQDYLEDYTLQPGGARMTVTTRGKLFDFGLWEGAARQHGSRQGVRYRLQRHLDDERVIVVSDEGGEEAFEIHHLDGDEEPQRIDTGDFDIGRPLELKVAPSDDAGDEQEGSEYRQEVAFTNHRNELVHLEVDTGAVQVVDKSEEFRIAGFDWSPDGRWLAYGFHDSWQTSRIKIAEVGSWETRDVSSGRYRDSQPVFDPEGRYLHFLSCRKFNPVYDQVFFELSFPQTMKPCVVTLSEEEASPFFEEPRPLNGPPGGAEAETSEEDDGEHGDGTDDSDEADGTDENRDDGESGGKDDDAVAIDFDGIRDRIESFPVPEAEYDNLAATDERVFWITHSIEGSLGGGGYTASETGGRLKYFSLKKQDDETFATKVSTFELGPDGSTLTLEATNGRLRVVDASGKGPAQSSNGGSEASRDTGWLDLSRLAVPVEPRREWAQMLREAWRLMRDNFWRRNMTGVDWEAVWERYSSRLGRVSTRNEFSDLVWTMQGELGTSHAYEMGGDYPSRPQYRPGFLGIDFEWSDEVSWERGGRIREGGFEITHIVRGAAWEERATSPLARPGVNVEEGDVIVAVDGTPVEADRSLQELLVHKAGDEVEVTIWKRDAPQDEQQDEQTAEEKITTHTVELLSSERKARYWEWVERNRDRVHEATDGQVGYVHIPDMGPRGFAEFHRSFLSEQKKDALVVDVRYNGGGHVSQLILEKLARKRIGWDLPRWGEAQPYPEGAIDGPIVALTNEFAGSDGDIFSHVFKLMDIGPLLGKRTWGGVIGIWPRHYLVDGSMTTQPEFASWFPDVGFELENAGTQPDEVVDDPPGSMQGGTDPQLKAAIERVREELEAEPPERPDFSDVPDRSPPDSLPEWE